MQGAGLAAIQQPLQKEQQRHVAGHLVLHRLHRRGWRSSASELPSLFAAVTHGPGRRRRRRYLILVTAALRAVDTNHCQCPWSPLAVVVTPVCEIPRGLCRRRQLVDLRVRLI